MSGRTIALVGAGPAGCAVIHELLRAGGRLVAACDPQKAGTTLAGQNLTAALPDVLDVDLLLLAVPDDAYATVAAGLSPRIRASVALQLSASAPLSDLHALRGRGMSVGLLHPAQSLVEGRTDDTIHNWTFCGDVDRADWVRDLLPAGAHLLELDPSEQIPYHIACTLLANMLPALWSLAARCWPGPEQDLDRFAPELMRSALENLLARGPVEGLSGPVRRGDRGTVARHLSWLAGQRAELLPAYRGLVSELVRLCGEPEAGNNGSTLDCWLSQSR